jgi:hypothetical protein
MLILDTTNWLSVVRDAKGGESRVTMLPDSAVESLEEHLQAVKRSDRKHAPVFSGVVLF